MKLTKAQWFVIHKLQNGGVIVHDDRNYCIAYEFSQVKIQWRVWQALTQGMGLIYQESQYPFDFLLTKKGKDYKHINHTVGRYKTS